MLKKIESILEKDWDDQKIKKYIGEFKSTWFTYSRDQKFRENAASGGSTTAILSYLLSKKEIDGALVCRYLIKEGKLLTELFIAQTEEDLLSSQGSKYLPVHFSSEAIPLIRDFDGCLAIVALPCDTKILRRYQGNNPEIGKKIRFVITLFCGHNSEEELTETIVSKLRPQELELKAFRHRSGKWRGNLTAEFEGGVEITRSFKYFSDYQNLYYFCQSKCHYCYDHTGYFSDISVGDIWSSKMKEADIKHNALIVRTDTGEQILKDVFSAEILQGQQEKVAEVCKGQARTMPFHYNISARSKAAKLLGMKIKDEVNEHVRWNEYLAAWIVLNNERFSKTNFGKKIVFRIPRFLIRIYLYLLKGLESF